MENKSSITVTHMDEFFPNRIQARHDWTDSVSFFRSY